MMGLLDMVQSMAAGSANPDHAKVAGGLVQELQNSPGGIGGLLQSFQQNGMGGLVQQWSSGQTQPANQAAVETGLGGSGIIDSIAQRTGLSPSVVKTGLAVAVPLLIHHVVSNNHVDATGQATGAQPDAGGLLQSLLSRMA
jgi:uncharacterized protein YidB (DUF937 family)